MQALQLYETTILDGQGRFGFTALTAPARSLSAEIRRIDNGADLIHRLAELLGAEVLEHGPRFPQMTEQFIYHILTREYGQEHDVFMFSNYVSQARIIPFEESPLSAESLATIAAKSAQAGSIVTGTTVGFLAAGPTPLLLVAVPLGIVLCGAAVSFSKWLEENRDAVWQRICGVSPTPRAGGQRRRPPPRQPEEQ